MNVELALEIIGMIALYPDAHDQSSWSEVPESVGEVTAGRLSNEPTCGTTLCFAGWATALTIPEDSVFAYGKSEVLVKNPLGLWFRNSLGKFTHFYRNEPQPFPKDAERYDRKSIMEHAEEALDLTRSQASWMFAPERTVDELLNGVRYLIAHPNADRYDLSIICSD